MNAFDLAVNALKLQNAAKQAVLRQPATTIVYADLGGENTAKITLVGNPSSGYIEDVLEKTLTIQAESTFCKRAKPSKAFEAVNKAFEALKVNADGTYTSVDIREVFERLADSIYNVAGDDEFEDLTTEFQ